jgi:hypothetical protein
MQRPQRKAAARELPGDLLQPERQDLSDLTAAGFERWIVERSAATSVLHISRTISFANIVLFLFWLIRRVEGYCFMPTNPVTATICRPRCGKVPVSVDELPPIVVHPQLLSVPTVSHRIL